MNTREIPREEWQGFLDDFSKRHEGESVTVKVLAGEMGDQTVVGHWPLKGITYDGETGSLDAITVIAGDERPTHDLNHIVPSPSRVLLAESDDGEPQGMKIESDTAPSTLLTFDTGPDPQGFDPY